MCACACECAGKCVRACVQACVFILRECVYTCVGIRACIVCRWDMSTEAPTHWRVGARWITDQPTPAHQSDCWLERGSRLLVLLNGSCSDNPNHGIVIASVRVWILDVVTMVV